MLYKPELIVFPTSRAIRSYIQKEKSKNLLLPFTLTIDEFLKKSIILKGKNYIDEEEKFLYLKDAIKDINIKKLGISNEFSKFLKQYEYIYRFFTELASENCQLEKIQEFDTYEYYYEHLEILKSIRNNYLKLLDENNLVDKINLSDNFLINEKFLDKFKNCTIIFEGYFTTQEFDIIKNISKYIDVNIELYSNKYNKKSVEIFNIYLEKPLKLDCKYKINLSTKSILEEHETNNKNNRYEIKAFSSRINQIAYIKSVISKRVNEGVNPSNIALVLPDESFASTIALFDNENYFNFAMGVDIKQSLLYQVSNGINYYINDDEIKYLENINHLKIDKKNIDDNIKSNWTKLCTKEKFLEVINYIKSFESNKELIEKLDELVYKLNILFFTKKIELSLKEIFKIYLQKLSSLKLDDVNSGKITVLGLLETRVINFDLVIICDFNEDYIPKKSLKDKFLSSKIKEAVGLPTIIDRQNLQKYYYKRLCDNSKELCISYVKSDSKQISLFASEIFANEIDEKLYDNSYKDILFKNRALKYLEFDIKELINLSKFVWSASSFKIFLECKRKFYLQYILKIKEHDLSLKPKPYELGNIVHKVLEDYYKLNNINVKDLLNNHTNDNPFLLYDLEIWKNKLEEFISYDKEYLEDKTILDMEKSFECEFEGIKIKGVIDRIDKHNDSLNLIDYKTSSSLKVDTLKTYEKSKDFQLEFYYIAMSLEYKTDKINAYYYDLSNIKLIEESCLDKKLELLVKKFEELKEISKEEISFDKCEDKITCLYCPYKTICNRE